MKLAFFSGLVGSILLSSCTPQSIHVRITSDNYRFGNTESKFATPVVDEVVRQKPRSVLIEACFGTPPAKIIQFEIELRARIETVLQLSWADQYCDS